MAKKYLNSDNPVYFTYSRNSVEKAEWKSIADVVDDLLKTFRKENIKYSVDKEDIKVGDKISAYEHEIGDAKYVIIILSDRYFYRYHCMFELCNILKNTEGKTIKYIKSGNFNIQSLEYRKKIKDYWVQQKALIENRIATYRNPDISLLEQSAIDNGFYLDFIDRLSKLFRDVSYENADNIRLGLLGSNPRHTQFVDEIKRDFGWRPSESHPAPKSKFNEKYIFYAIMAVMLGVIIWLSNRTSNPVGVDIQRERDSIASAEAAKAAEEKRRQDSIASANAAKAAEEARIAEQKRIKDSIAKAEAKKNSTTQPISGTASGHPYVDLGLPSRTLWATTNIGAANPWDYGDYFAWGETTTKSKYDWSTLKYCEDNTGDKFSKYNTQSKYGSVDNKTTLERSDDAATANWGSEWRMPTSEERDALINKCYWVWTSNYKGHSCNGYIVYKALKESDKGVKIYDGKTADAAYSPDRVAHIFLPAAGWKGKDGTTSGLGSFGYYWSSSLGTGYPNYARSLGFGSSGVYTSGDGRDCGRSVRPVRCKN